MALYLDGKKIVNSLVIDGEAFYKATILEGTASTDKWAEPLVYDVVNVLNYDILCFKGTDQGTAFHLYYTVADLPISAQPTQDNDHTQFSTNGYLYVDTNGHLYFCVTTTKTLVLNEIIAYGGEEKSGADIKELCCLNCAGADSIQIPYMSSLPTYNDYANYLSYNTSTRKFEVLQDFTAVITGWVRNYDRASSTYSEGRTRINDVDKLSYQVNSVATGTKAGKTETFLLKTGDTVYPYTPSRNGYPEQHLKIYRLAPALNITDEIKAFSDEGA